MTAVEFHHNAPDRTATLCRLIAARVAEGGRVRVVASDPAQAALLDRALWTFEALSFVPHCVAGAPGEEESPVVIGPAAPARSASEVLVNFSDDVPPQIEGFATLIEVVGQDATEREKARARFRQYRERGWPLTTHDVSEAAPRG